MMQTAASSRACAAHQPAAAAPAAARTAAAASVGRRSALGAAAAAALALLPRPALAAGSVVDSRALAADLAARQAEASATFFRRERELADELTRTRLELEKDAGFDTNAGPDTVCANRTGIDVVGVTQGVALLGALVGGISSRQRKREVEELNEKLRNVNSALRAQARSGVTFAPGLNYAPPPAAPAAPPPAGEQEMSEMRAALKEGRARLKENAGAAAMVPFKKALMLSRQSGDRQAERRAMRGLAVARRQQGDRPGAIQALQAVLEISGALGEHTGDTDALGAIADLYTEMDDLEQAGLYYDKYIARLQGTDSGTVD